MRTAGKTRALRAPQCLTPVVVVVAAVATSQGTWVLIAVRPRSAAPVHADLACPPQAGIASDLPAASRQQGTISHSWLAGPADGPAVMPTRAAAAASGPPPPPDSAAAHRGAPPYTTSAPPPPQSGAELSSDAAAVAGVLRNLRPGVSFSRMDPETFRIMVRAEAEAMARARGGSDGGGGGGAGGGVGANSRPADPSYQPRYDKPQYDPAPADRRSYDFESSRYAAADRFDGGMYGASGRGMGGGYGKYNDTAGGGHDVGMGARAEERPSARQAWGGPSAPYPSSVEAGAPQVGVYGNDMRASMAAAGPVKSSAARALWAGPGQEAYDGSTNDARSAAPASPPPPYAIHTSDSSYAFRQPANVVGAGVGGRPGGASGALGGGGGDKASGQSPFGTEDTAKVSGSWQFTGHGFRHKCQRRYALWVRKKRRACAVVASVCWALSFTRVLWVCHYPCRRCLRAARRWRTS